LVERRGGRKKRGDIKVSPLVFKRLSDENLVDRSGGRERMDRVEFDVVGFQRLMNPST